MTSTYSNSVTVFALNPAVDISYEVPQLVAGALWRGLELAGVQWAAPGEA